MGAGSGAGALRGPSAQCTGDIRPAVAPLAAGEPWDMDGREAAAVRPLKAHVSCGGRAAGWGVNVAGCACRI